MPRTLTMDTKNLIKLCAGGARRAGLGWYADRQFGSAATESLGPPQAIRDAPGHVQPMLLTLGSQGIKLTKKARWRSGVIPDVC
jgi:hypothetical protein